MIQKKIWMPFFVFGISIFILTLNGCSDTEPGLKVNIYYKNETNHIIKYYELVNDNKRFLFELNPNTEKFIENTSEGGNENQTVDNCCSGILADFQGDNSILIEYNNNDKCLIYNYGEGSTTANFSSYESRKIDDNTFEFIYRFTEDEYNLAEDCN